MLHEKWIDDWLLKFNFVSAIKIWQEHPGSEDAFRKAEYWVKTTRDMGCPIELGVKKEVLDYKTVREPSILKTEAERLGRQTHDRIIFEITPPGIDSKDGSKMSLRLGKVRGQPFLVLENMQKPVGFFRPEEILSLQIK